MERRGRFFHDFQIFKFIFWQRSKISQKILWDSNFQTHFHGFSFKSKNFKIHNEAKFPPLPLTWSKENQKVSFKLKKKWTAKSGKTKKAKLVFFLFCCVEKHLFVKKFQISFGKELQSNSAFQCRGRQNHSNSSYSLSVTTKSTHETHFFLTFHILLFCFSE